ncbi:hypothetical protein BGW39_005786 [Mortierella sp. 14UC]|nr:hypothetical protein BGW39_005786 [Mortierella sp. 14UC]
MIQFEVNWLKQVSAHCVLTDAPFLPCAAASALGIPACLITNFTFDEVYRYLREGDPLDKDVIACADAALEDYKKATLLLRLPGSIDIPSFASEIKILEADRSHQQFILSQHPNAITQHEGTIDVPMVVRKAINTREDVLRALGVDEETIRTKKMVLVSFGGQRLKQGWGNPLPEGWIGVICGLPVSHELPEGFYRSPHGVYVPDLTHAADIVIGKLGYGTCSECIAHDTALIYVSRPQFIEEHGLIKMMIKHGLPVEMTAEEFETGLWQRSILEADRLTQEEKAGRKQFMEERAATAAALTMGSIGVDNRGGGNDGGLGSTSSNAPAIRRKRSSSFSTRQFRASKARSLAESVNMAELARGGPISPHGEDEDNPPLLSPARSRRSMSISTLSSATLPSKNHSNNIKESEMMEELERLEVVGGRHEVDGCEQRIGGGVSSESEWFERRIPHNGGEICARLVEEYMWQWDQCSSTSQ